MKMLFQVLLIGILLLSGCAQGVNVPATVTPNPTNTLTATPLPTQTETATFTPTAEITSTLLVDQDALKEEWESAINNAIILSSTCEWMFETFAMLQEGEIDLQKAKSQLSIESDFARQTRWDLPAAYENEVLAEFMLQLETQMRELIEFIDANKNTVDASGALDSLYPVCESSFGLLNEIVNAAMDAGLTEESVDEVDVSRTEMYKDYFERIFGEN